MLRMKVFGPFELKGPEGPVDLSSSKLTALISYLALAGKTVSRDVLATLLWGSHFEEQARQNLRQALVRLRKAIGGDLLVSSDSTVHLLPTALDCDAVAFERLSRENRPGALRQSVGLLDGELLAGLDVKQAGFEEWLAKERRRLDLLACDALVRLGAAELEQGNASQALKHAGSCIERDWYREDAHRLAMLSLAALGQRAEAVRHFQDMAERLRRDLDTAPEAATIETAEHVRSLVAAAPVAAAQQRKPSIAVLPFTNLSGDPEQDYFADGVVEEIIMALSRMHWLFVIARNSSFTYKGRAVDVRQVGRELGVRYVLEGSLRKSGARVRIAGHLVDAETGATLWADRFEGELEDLFDLQDKITQHTMAAISPRLEEAEIARSKHKPTGSLDAYDCFLRGRAGLHLWTRAGTDDALRYFRRAIELDPDFAPAYGLAARSHTLRKAMNWMADKTAETSEAIHLAERAAELGREDAVALGTAGFALTYVANRFDDGDRLAERAIQVNPNFAWGWFFSGFIKAVSGEPDIGIARSSRALQLSPHDPHLYSFELSIATAHYIAQRYAEALAQAEKVTRVQPERFSSLAFKAASLAQLGRVEEARVLVRKLSITEPGISLANLRWRFPIKRDEDFLRWQDGLRLAGMPEA